MLYLSNKVCNSQYLKQVIQKFITELLHKFIICKNQLYVRHFQWLKADIPRNNETAF